MEDVKEGVGRQIGRWLRTAGKWVWHGTRKFPEKTTVAAAFVARRHPVALGGLLGGAVVREGFKRGYDAPIAKSGALTRSLYDPSVTLTVDKTPPEPLNAPEAFALGVMIPPLLLARREAEKKKRWLAKQWGKVT